MRESKRGKTKKNEDKCIAHSKTHEPTITNEHGTKYDWGRGTRLLLIECMMELIDECFWSWLSIFGHPPKSDVDGREGNGKGKEKMTLRLYLDTKRLWNAAFVF